MTRSGRFYPDVAGSGLGVLSILESSALAAVAMLVMRCVTYEDAGNYIDYSVLVVIACAFAIGTAVAKVGLADLLAEAVLAIANTPLLALIGVHLVTKCLTEMMTNNAAAIVMFPIAMSVSASLGVSFEPFAVVVMIAASASFMTPTGCQTNLMVMGSGGYRFSDYVKAGAPLGLLVALISWVLIPQIWPFNG